MNGLNVDQFREHVVQPTLKFLNLWSPAAENLLIGTAITESRLQYVAQLQNGPARSVFQMEPRTHDDIWEHFLPSRPDVAEKLELLLGDLPDGLDPMVGNLFYATGMARVFYLRIPKRLPHCEDSHGMAEYWKKYYNTMLGKGIVSDAIPHFAMAIS